MRPAPQAGVHDRRRDRQAAEQVQPREQHDRRAEAPVQLRRVLQPLRIPNDREHVQHLGRRSRTRSHPGRAPSPVPREGAGALATPRTRHPRTGPSTRGATRSPGPGCRARTVLIKPATTTSPVAPPANHNAGGDRAAEPDDRHPPCDQVRQADRPHRAPAGEQQRVQRDHEDDHQRRRGLLRSVAHVAGGDADDPEARRRGRRSTGRCPPPSIRPPSPPRARTARATGTGGTRPRRRGGHPRRRGRARRRRMRHRARGSARRAASTPRPRMCHAVARANDQRCSVDGAAWRGTPRAGLLRYRRSPFLAPDPRPRRRLGGGPLCPRGILAQHGPTWGDDVRHERRREAPRRTRRSRETGRETRGQTSAAPQGPHRPHGDPRHPGGALLHRRGPRPVGAPHHLQHRALRRDGRPAGERPSRAGIPRPDDHRAGLHGARRRRSPAGGPAAARRAARVPGRATRRRAARCHPVTAAEHLRQRRVRSRRGPR